ncbi:tRNA pseudouridine(55) synthase TruB [Lentilactobacillus laojiaonis]|uniref:tRNA pseudouridine(55) synthase TruB n=1 Tax=Lentilactobacillus laojiaonis TaxID=2883998 RepID=UPI001D0AF8D1|nr:tRNA pseudouridine(55) synthase TruB [Lentilactobacillus laojiaonis]UDM31648.1 tRNA pseudouridine(55) synthase TruB [Lentilactobacillus laojiaonis]
MNGIIALYKERGMTSHDCISSLRKILHTKKIGHTGTLDPDVDGVLPICVGTATKLSELIMNSGKKYRGEITLGFSTTTEDISGEIIDKKPILTPLDNEQINSLLEKLTGDIEQVPPMYSAVKINGKKLYEYAREGIEIDRPARLIHISYFKQIKDSYYDEVNQTQTIYFEVGCSKGTYVRTLAVDFGRLINVPSVMSDLTRIESGGFTIADTSTLAEVKEKMDNDEIVEILHPLKAALTKYPTVLIDDNLWNNYVVNGAFIKPSLLNIDSKIIALEYQGDIQALYQFDSEKNLYRPYKMLKTI